MAATCRKSLRFREAIANGIVGCPQNAAGALRNARFDAASKETTGDAQYVKTPADTNDELQAHFWATIVLGDKGATVLKNSAQWLHPAALPTFRSERTERNDAEQRSRRCNASNTQETAPRAAPPEHSRELRFSAVEGPQKRGPLSGIENGSSRPKPDSFAGRPARQASLSRTRNSNRRHPVASTLSKAAPRQSTPTFAQHSPNGCESTNGTLRRKSSKLSSASRRISVTKV